MDEVKRLEKELKDLKDKRSKEQKIAELKKQIDQEKFNQTKFGKFLKSAGKFLDDQGKKLEEKPKKNDLNDLINRLPQ